MKKSLLLLFPQNKNQQALTLGTLANDEHNERVTNFVFSSGAELISHSLKASRLIYLNLTIDLAKSLLPGERPQYFFCSAIIFRTF